MYIEHFKLSHRPFSRVPSAERCVMYPSLQSCFDRAAEGIAESAGPVLVIGPTGCGKSTLLALLEAKFKKESSVVTLNCAAIETRHELIQCLLFELGLPFQSDSVGELRLKLIDHLKSPDHCPDGLLLLIDEAHSLPMEVLEELRMITNLVCGSKHQIRLVIAGGRALEEKFLHPILETFNQRIGVRCYLQPMSRSETMFFALAQIKMCGQDGRDIFKPSSLEKTYDITDGVPRLVAQLCDHSLKMAAQSGLSEISPAMVQTAWLDLQQLPATAANEQEFQAGPASAVIEFGTLDSNPSPIELNSGEPEQIAGAHGETRIDPLSENHDADLADPLADEVIEELAKDSPEGLASSDAQEPNDQPFPAPHIAEPQTSGTTNDQKGKAIESTLESLLEQLDRIDEEEQDQGESAVAENTGAVSGPSPVKESPAAASQQTADQPVGAQNTPSPEAPAASTPESASGNEGVSPETQERMQSLSKAIEEAQKLADQEYEVKRKKRAGLQYELPVVPINVQKTEDNSGTETDSGLEQPVADAPNTGTDLLDSGSNVVPTEHFDTLPASTTTPTISSEELFGGFDEEEQVIDLNSARMADQNRTSASMTTPEIANVTPVDHGQENDQPVQQAEPQIVVTPSPATMTQQWPIQEPDEPSQSTAPPANPVEPTKSPASANATQQWPPADWDRQTPSATPTETPTASQTPVENAPAPNPPRENMTQQWPPHEETVAEDQDRQDDSDMLVVEEREVPPTPEPKSDDQQTSTGQVVRMNYQDLFQQLRNQSNT